MLRFYEDLFFSAALGSFASAQQSGREKNMCYILTCIEDHKLKHIHLLSFEALNFWRPCTSVQLAHALGPALAGKETGPRTRERSAEERRRIRLQRSSSAGREERQERSSSADPF
jgi:hypothetical protein